MNTQMHNEEERLRELVARVKGHQGDMSDAGFCRKYEKYVGTTRTWKDRLLKGDFTQVDVARKVSHLSELLAYIEGGAIREDYFEDMPFNMAFRKGLSRLESQHATDRRIFCVLGAVGVGKTMSSKAALREVADKNYQGSNRVLIIVPEALRENKSGLLETIATSLNCVPEQSGSAALFDAVKKALSQTNPTLIFDEAHQGGVMLMRILKDLVNHTEARFVYVALRTEYMRVVSASKGNIVEAKQFIRRCLQPVFMSYADGTKAATEAANPADRAARTVPMDAAILLQRKAGISMAEAQKLAVEKIGNLRTHGNLSSLADAIEEAIRDADDAGVAMDSAVIAGAIDRICPAVAGR